MPRRTGEGDFRGAFTYLPPLQKMRYPKQTIFFGFERGRLRGSRSDTMGDHPRESFYSACHQPVMLLIPNPVWRLFLNISRLFGRARGARSLARPLLLPSSNLYSNLVTT